MKKLYLLLFTFCLLTQLPTRAQSTTGRAYVGYAKFSDQIWEYDGLSLDHNAKVGCAALLTREMLEPYVGGTIVGMRVGWDTSTQTGTYNAFVRQDFNGEDLSTGKGTVRYSYSDAMPGWNNLTMSNYQIPEDVQQLVVGFTTTLKKDVCAIPMLYPHDTPNSCYLWVEGDNDENGAPIWRDMKERGILPILLTIKDTQGTFNFLPSIVSLVDNGVVWTDEPTDGLMRIRNKGSQTIKSLELTSRQGEQSFSKKVNLSQTITTGNTSRPIMMPLYCFHTGDVEVSITKVNDHEVPYPPTWTVNFIGVPPAVGEQYERRPLVEYYESENSYMSPRYFDEYVGPSLKNKLDYLTFVCQHMDDQFMTGDDDATMLALRLCDNDSSQVSIPAMTIDRGMATDNILFQQAATSNPMFNVLLEPYASQVLNEAMNNPTFVALEANGYWQKDGETVDIIVGGNVEPGIMPEGEQPRLTVYLMERNVDTDSQLFWTDKEKEESMGQYTHANVIREILSDVEGDAIPEGAISAAYQTQADPSWNLENLYVVAFVHRDGRRGGKYMHVFNSAQGEITDGTGIRAVNGERLKNGKWAGTLFDLSGRHVSRASKGIYLKNGKKVVK